MLVTVIALKYALLVSQWSYGHFRKLTDSILGEQLHKSSPFNSTDRAKLYPQHGDRIVTTDSVTSLHPVYCYRCSVFCVSVGHNRESYKNGWTDRADVRIVECGDHRFCDVTLPYVQENKRKDLANRSCIWETTVNTEIVNCCKKLNYTQPFKLNIQRRHNTQNGT